MWRSLKNEKESNYFFPFFSISAFLSLSQGLSRRSVSPRSKEKKKKAKNLLSLETPKAGASFCSLCDFLSFPKKAEETRENISTISFRKKREKSRYHAHTKKQNKEREYIYITVQKRIVYIILYIRASKLSLFHSISETSLFSFLGLFLLVIVKE